MNAGASTLLFMATWRFVRTNNQVFFLSLVAALVLLSEVFRLRRPERKEPKLRRKAWRYRLAGALVTAALPLAGSLRLSLRFKVGRLPDSVEGIVAFAILAGWAGCIWYCFSKARMLLTPRASDAITWEARAPIVLCRSFLDDDLLLEHSFERVMGDKENKEVVARHLQQGGLVRYEQVIEKQAWDYGPLITVGEPGVIRHGGGALREHFPDDEWQKRVDEWMKAARFVVVMVNWTEGLRWEIANILAQGYSAKTIFLVPPAKDRAARWRFLAKFQNAPWSGGRVLEEIDCGRALGFYGTDKDQGVVLQSEHDWDRDYEVASHLGIYGVWKGGSPNI